MTLPIQPPTNYIVPIGMIYERYKDWTKVEEDIARFERLFLEIHSKLKVHMDSLSSTKLNMIWSVVEGDSKCNYHILFICLVSLKNFRVILLEKIQFYLNQRQCSLEIKIDKVP